MCSRMRVHESIHTITHTHIMTVFQMRLGNVCAVACAYTKAYIQSHTHTHHGHLSNEALQRICTSMRTHETMHAITHEHTHNYRLSNEALQHPVYTFEHLRYAAKITYVCVYVCMYTYIYTHICITLGVHFRASSIRCKNNICVCVYVCIHIYIYTHTHMYHVGCTLPSIFDTLQTEHMCVCMYTYIYIYIHTYV